MRLFFKSASILAPILLSGLSCSSTSDWQFEDAKYTLVVTQGTVISQHRPIIAVVRNAADGQWMFFADLDPYLDTVVTLTLEEMAKIDKTVLEVADLPLGWKAVRSKPGEPWQRTKI